MAQLVEHILGKDEVPSSNLGSSSRKNPICNADGIFSVKFVPYGTSEIRWRV